MANLAFVKTTIRPITLHLYSIRLGAYCLLLSIKLLLFFFATDLVTQQQR